MSNKTKSIIYLLLANTIWAFSGLIIRKITMPGTMTLFMSGVGACIALIIYAISTKKVGLIKKIKFDKLNLLYLFLIATMGVLIFNAFADASFPIAATNLILNSVPFLTVTTAAFLIKERSTIREYVFAFVGFLGLVVFIYGQQGGISFGTVSVGLFLSLGALFLNNIAGLVNRVISQASNELTIPTLTALGNLLFAPIFVILLNQFKPELITASNILWGLILGVFSSFLGFLFITLAYQNLKAQTVSVINLIQPIFTGIIGYVFLAEGFNSVMIAGGLIVLISTAGIVSSKEKGI